ncbi:putative membrane protein [Methanohalophilus levihalophilus]|uniref:DUF1616 domain-containing protein n=1 Tax=Methanohalophilus levihalophilus TaxID=1431282 RepID=UPI001AE5D9FA|nr:DUF1616 domain-containing protein [Methanohalophilus levihalophilus]MBP2029458.1 putative membrane protein [Methanohalophilus levihalophilus]
MFKSKKCIYKQDLALLLLFSLLACIFVLLPPLNETPLRIIFALPLLFFIPGYAFIAALFPRNDSISGIERFTLSVGFSIAIVVFDGFAVSMTEWLFRPNSISISLSLITLILVEIAYFARRRHPEEEQFSFSFKDFVESIKKDDDKTVLMSKEERDRQKMIEKALVIALVLSIVIATAMFAYAKVTREKETFTALYILGPDGKAENYPTVASPTQPLTVTVGIENHELEKINYILQMRHDGTVIQELQIPLEDGETWLEDMTYPGTQLKQDQSKLEFVIFKEEVANFPYRSVHLWITHDLSGIDLPFSTVLPLPSHINSTSFMVQWEGTHPNNEPIYFNIEYSTNGVNWIQWISSTERTLDMFTGEEGRTYYFRSKAIDDSGIEEFVENVPDAQTTIDLTNPEISLSLSKSGTQLNIRATSSEELEDMTAYVTALYFSADPVEVEMSSSDGITWSGTYTITNADKTHLIEVVGKDFALNSGEASENF